MRNWVIIAVAMLAGGCAVSEVPGEMRMAHVSSATTVQARGETVPVGTANADAADDPAIWRNRSDPSASLVLGTDKQAGIYVYGLNGKVRDFVNAGRVNNIDLRDDVIFADGRGILAVASDRNDLMHAKLALFRLDPDTAKLTALGTVDAGNGEAYGVCLGRSAGRVSAFSVLKDGTINQVALDLSGVTTKGQIVRSMKLGTQSEGCAVDDRTGLLYVTEEDVGLWRFDAAADGSKIPFKIAGADGRNIVADAEGVALIPEGARGGYVVLSSQGDNAYVLYTLADNSYVGRFRISAGAVGGTEETDGIDFSLGDFGPNFPGGLLVAQDGYNPQGAQNFKLVAWQDIATALNLPKGE
ncbi:3-phytase [Sphingobium sp. SCG-1]|uniref:phytase n=1 Tax=Sphingobium sp. SCG-1 TaxID=2072936 RepID=UPI000CD6B32C|nr:phytase [Sphingobium sp. SCG-1]AUW58803.1 3-phytase [Sphingobium sp. SCG-1]